MSIYLLAFSYRLPLTEELHHTERALAPSRLHHYRQQTFGKAWRLHSTLGHKQLWLQPRQPVNSPSLKTSNRPYHTKVQFSRFPVRYTTLVSSPTRPRYTQEMVAVWFPHISSPKHQHQIPQSKVSKSLVLTHPGELVHWLALKRWKLTKKC